MTIKTNNIDIKDVAYILFKDSYLWASGKHFRFEGVLNNLKIYDDEGKLWVEMSCIGRYIINHDYKLMIMRSCSEVRITTGYIEYFQ